jgi:hypothetical protein
MRNEVLYSQLEGMLLKFKKDEDLYQFCLASINSLAELSSSVILTNVFLSIVKHLEETTHLSMEMMEVLDSLVDTATDIFIWHDTTEASLLQTLQERAKNRPKLRVALEHLIALNARAPDSEPEFHPLFKKQKLQHVVDTSAPLPISMEDEIDQIYAAVEALEEEDDEEEEEENINLYEFYSIEEVEHLVKAYQVQIPIEALSTLMALYALLDENTYAVNPLLIMGLKEVLNLTMTKVAEEEELDYSQTIKGTALKIEELLAADCIDERREFFDCKLNKVIRKVPADILLPQLLWMEYFFAIIASTPKNKKKLFTTLLQHNASLQSLLKPKPKKLETVSINPNELQELLSSVPARCMKYLGLTRVSGNGMKLITVLQNTIRLIPEALQATFCGKLKGIFLQVEAHLVDKQLEELNNEALSLTSAPAAENLSDDDLGKEEGPAKPTFMGIEGEFLITDMQLCMDMLEIIEKSGLDTISQAEVWESIKTSIAQNKGEPLSLQLGDSLKNLKEMFPNLAPPPKIASSSPNPGTS